MSYNLRCTNVSLGNSPSLAPTPSPSTHQPESSPQGANPRRGNRTPGINAAEGSANNPNLAVTIRIKELQAILQGSANLDKFAQQNPCRRY